jgi:NAD+ kinase
MGHGERNVLLVVHTGRQVALDAARDTVARLSASGVGVRVLAGEAGELETDAPVCALGAEALEDIELVVVLGGDGTMLRGAEVARSAGVPLLGVNLGRVGFLAEAEYEDLAFVVDRIVARDYTVEERMTLDVEVSLDGQVVDRSWALNEASVEKASRERMLEVLVSIDGRPLSKWGCDGVIFATPTGSTAYNFSAGGPIVWPDLDALLLVPISAHALFARPLVVSPHSLLALELQPNGDEAGSKGAVMWCDGRRVLDLAAGARVEVRRGAVPVRFARLHRAPFSDRLVAKFALPVDGWRVEK